jgi:hypothetical protein
MHVRVWVDVSAKFYDAGGQVHHCVVLWLKKEDCLAVCRNWCLLGDSLSLSPEPFLELSSAAGKLAAGKLAAVKPAVDA